jgi:hypothetical protein
MGSQDGHHSAFRARAHFWRLSGRSCQHSHVPGLPIRIRHGFLDAPWSCACVDDGNRTAQEQGASCRHPQRRSSNRLLPCYLGWFWLLPLSPFCGKPMESASCASGCPRHEEAHRILRKLHDPDEATIEIAQIEAQVKVDQTLPVTWLSMVTKPSYRKRTLYAIGLACGIQFTGVLVINSESPNDHLTSDIWTFTEKACIKTTVQQSMEVWVSRPRKHFSTKPVISPSL